MERKDTENSLEIANIAWKILDNFGDKLIEDLVGGLTPDLLPSILCSSIIIGTYKA